MKLNNSEQMETMVVTLSKEKTPIAFEQKVLSLIDSGFERHEAERFASDPIHVEMYYNPNAGLFLVESDAVESGTIYDPYSGELMDEFDEE
jgi:hypothetical protein